MLRFKKSYYKCCSSLKEWGESQIIGKHLLLQVQLAQKISCPQVALQRIHPGTSGHMLPWQWSFNTHRRSYDCNHFKEDKKRRNLHKHRVQQQGAKVVTFVSRTDIILFLASLTFSLFPHTLMWGSAATGSVKVYWESDKKSRGPTWACHKNWSCVCLHEHHKCCFDICKACFDLQEDSTPVGTGHMWHVMSS